MRLAFSNELTKALNETGFRSTTMNPPSAAAHSLVVVLSSSAAEIQFPRSDHEREERSFRTPFSPGRS